MAYGVLGQPGKLAAFPVEGETRQGENLATVQLLQMVALIALDQTGRAKFVTAKPVL